MPLPTPLIAPRPVPHAFPPRRAALARHPAVAVHPAAVAALAVAALLALSACREPGPAMPPAPAPAAPARTALAAAPPATVANTARPTATLARLPADVPLTATALFSSLRATPIAPAPRTGGADPGAAAPLALALAAKSGLSPNAMLGASPVAVDPAGAGGEGYAAVHESPFAVAAEAPLSTFGVDVDAASYGNIRRFLEGGQLPPHDAVRIEELVNYFPYDDPRPAPGEAPVRVNVALTHAPWRPEHRLLRVNLATMPIDAADRPASNLVFLIDVSGSMHDPAKLPLVKQALRLLVEQLDARDRVAIVVYAGASGVALEPTSGNRQDAILQAIDALLPGGSTAGSEGIALAYELAEANLVQGGVNRVILATDGDFNVGVTDRAELEALIRAQARTGVFLTVLGFGMGNLQDATLETLADRGNGHYAYVDGLAEARKVLVEELGATLATAAKDVKVQVEFNPARVAGYRLIGYENRLLAAEDFNDDAKDGGEVGAGHRVTALYEIVPAGAPVPAPPEPPVVEGDEPALGEAQGGLVVVDAGAVLRAVADLTGPGPASDGAPDLDPLFYADPAAAQAGEVATVKVRFKRPEAEASERLDVGVPDAPNPFGEADADVRFAAAVASFGMMLRDSPYRGGATWGHVAAWAKYSLGDDAAGHRKAFLALVERAAALAAEVHEP